MTAFDFKKERQDLYQPATAPAIVDVPAMLFLMADGQGDPNVSEAFQSALEALYGLAYAIRMNKAEADYFAFVVPPSEGFWNVADPQASIRNGVIQNKEDFSWTLALRQPGFVTPGVVSRAKDRLAKKKPHLSLDGLRLEAFAEGLCVQAMHLGPYDTEPTTIQAMHRYQEQRGFKLSYTPTRRHHELYLSNPKTTAPEAMKTVIRLPIKRR